MSGRVVHVKRDPYDVYVGRPTRWGNPYSHKPETQARYRAETREQAIGFYRRWLWAELQAGRITLAELDGKTLACWCAPKPCHAEVLLEAAAWAAAELRRRAG